MISGDACQVIASLSRPLGIAGKTDIERRSSLGGGAVLGPQVAVDEATLGGDSFEVDWGEGFHGC